MNKWLRAALPLGLVGILLATALGVYYYLHFYIYRDLPAWPVYFSSVSRLPPYLPLLSFHLISALADGGLALSLTFIAGGLGQVCLNRLVSASSRPPPAPALLAPALGFGLFGLLMLGLGLARLLYPALIGLLVLAAYLLLWRHIRQWLTHLRHTLRALLPSDWFGWVCAVFVGGTLLQGLLRALAPPLMWDALTYHLTLPQFYAQAHALNPPVDILFTGMPQLNEMLFTAASLLRGAQAAQVLGWVFGALLALGLAMVAAKLIGPPRAWLAPAILYSAYTFALSLAWAYSELLLMLFTLAGLVALWQWRETHQWRWLCLGGVLAGLAVGCKYTTLIVPLAAGAVIGLGSLWPPRRLSAAGFLPPAIFLLAALLTFSPWLLKNWLFTGNPVYPLLFPAAYMDSLRQWIYSRPDLAEHNPGLAALIFLRTTFLGRQGGNDYDATLGPLWVALLAGLLFAQSRLTAREREAAGPLALFVGVGYLGWVISMPMSYFAVQARLFFGLFPALALLGSLGWMALHRLDAPRRLLSGLLNLAVLGVLCLSTLEQSTLYLVPWPYLLGQQTAAAYRQANLGWYPLAISQINNLPAGARVVFLWETRALDCNPPDRCAPDVVIDRWWHLRQTQGPAAAILAHWRAARFTHVLISDTGADFIRHDTQWPLTAADWEALQTLRDQLTRVENIGGAYSLYALP